MKSSNYTPVVPIQAISHDEWIVPVIHSSSPGLGIDSDAAGFAKAKIEPYLGTIKSIGGEIVSRKIRDYWGRMKGVVASKE